MITRRDANVDASREARASRIGSLLFLLPEVGGRACSKRKRAGSFTGDSSSLITAAAALLVSYVKERGSFAARDASLQISSGHPDRRVALASGSSSFNFVSVQRAAGTVIARDQ